MTSIQELSGLVGDLTNYREKLDVERLIRDKVSEHVRLRLIYSVPTPSEKRILMDILVHIFSQELVDDILSELCLLKSIYHH